MMSWSQLVKRRIDSVAPDAPLTDVARKMIAHGTGTVAVCRNGRLIGVLTVRDLILRTTSEGRDPRQARVSEVMSQHVPQCWEDEPPEVALHRMKRNRLRRIWVIARDGRLAGTVSLNDLQLYLDEIEADGAEAHSLRTGRDAE
jgi:CBS domain-containing protein